MLTSWKKSEDKNTETKNMMITDEEVGGTHPKLS